jgi:hypothetical protein
MPSPVTKKLFRGLFFSSTTLEEKTGWDEAVIRDYLSILENLIVLADRLDVEIDQKIEEIKTDFTNGSIPFAAGGYLVENNSRLFWDNTNNILKITGIVQSTGRLKGGTVVTNAMSPYTILATDETVIADTDTGVIALLLPAGVESTAYRVENAGMAGNDVTLTPNGSEKLFGVNASEFLIDLEHLDIQYSSKGWN